MRETCAWGGLIRRVVQHQWMPLRANFTLWTTAYLAGAIEARRASSTNCRQTASA